MFLLHVNIKDAQKKMTEEELRTIVDVSQENGVIEHEERDMIHNLFDFGDAEAKEIMVPRIDMTFVQADATYQEVLDIFRQDMFTRLPVYEDSTDNVIGIINMKDFLLQNDTPEFSVRNLLREPYFTYEHKNTADLFLEMRKSSISLAIVLDEYGVTAGLITLEDLLEEIVGEIRDEYDTDEKEALSKINDTTYRVDGSFKLDDLNDELGTKLESEDNDSVGGLIVERLDRLPKAGDKITVDNVWMFVEKVASNRAESVIVKIIPEKKDETKKAN